MRWPEKIGNVIEAIKSADLLWTKEAGHLLQQRRSNSRRREAVSDSRIVASSLRRHARATETPKH
jgi:hypothetical protein